LAVDALWRAARWVEENFDLSLRAALVPVSDMRASGHDVRVGRFGASPAVAYAMFSGHGVEWTEGDDEGRQCGHPGRPGPT